MLKLIKYEFVKKSKFLLMLLICTIIINIGIGIIGGEGGMGLFLGLYPIVLGVIYLYELIKTYSDDLNKKSGYMLFMTPNSGYKIIGSKLITIILEGFIFAITYIIFALINLAIIAYIEVGNLSLIADGLSQIIEGINMLMRGTFGISIGDLLLVFILGIVSAIVFVLTVYAAITIRKSIFSNTKFGGILSFVIYIILNIIIIKLSDIVNNMFNFDHIISEVSVSATYPSAQMFQMFSISIVFSCIIGAALMLGSGYLIEKKINL